MGKKNEEHGKKTENINGMRIFVLVKNKDLSSHKS